ncbi:hypothetical protein AgCh_000760 [Apium graveolens]
MDEIKSTIEQVKKDINEKIEYKLLESTMKDIHQKIRKDFELSNKIENLDSRLTAMENAVTKVLLNQVHQTLLHQKLAVAQTPTPAILDDNKKRVENVNVQVSKGEENVHVQVSKVIVPSITFSKPPILDNIDLINIEAAELKLKEQMKKLDERIEKEFGPIANKDKSVKHVIQLRPISIDEMKLGNMERGQTSSKRHQHVIVILMPKKHSSKYSSKNPMDLVYATPKPDEKKLLGHSIANHKDPRDSVLKKRDAIEAKKQAENPANKSKTEKPATKIEIEKPATKTETEKHEEPKQKLGKGYKKQRTKRKLVFEEEKEKTIANSVYYHKSTMSIMEQAEIKVHPDVNFHGEPIIPKDEPMDWESLPIPELNIPIPATSKRRKNIPRKSVKSIPFQSKTLSKANPTVNKGDQLFIYVIKEAGETQVHYQES